MKRMFLGLLIASLGILNEPAATLAGRAGAAGLPPAPPEACPALSIKISGVEVTPKQPAQQHIVKVSWAANTPQCFTINKFTLRGTITFANGQTKSFSQTAPGNLTTVLIQVPGLLTLPAISSPALAPRGVKVGISADASSPVAGQAGNLGTTGPSEGDVVSPPLTSCLPLAPASNVQGVFAGLIFSPENPNGTHFPKVKVTWQVNNLPACYKIDTFSITAMLRGTGGTKSKSETVSGSLRATEIVFDNFPVSADFKPGVIVANIKATGTARITGSAQNETQLN